MSAFDHLLKRIGSLMPAPMNLPAPGLPVTPQLVGLNKDVTIYPYGKDDTFIQFGYNRNAWVYAIVSKCAKKLAQIPFYHYKIKTTERKTYFDEYLTLTRTRLDTKAAVEARKMLRKSVDQVIVDDPLSKFLKKPNRNQTGTQFVEQLYGYKLLTGEGNTWFSRTDVNQPPLEMFIIPKKFLALVHGADAWDIASFKFILGGNNVPIDRENVLMWKFPNYVFDPLMLTHLRGQSPLDAGILLMQASNDGQERLVAMNKNQGVAGMAYEKNRPQKPTPEQAMMMRQQFDSIVNDSDLAGKVAVMSGDWGYIQFGLSAEQLQLIEQSDMQFKGLCNIYDIPWQLFGNADSYENRKHYKRDFVYDQIAVAAYSLRDEWNNKLIPDFGLDRERDVIDCDILSLPELGEDLQTQAKTVTNLWVLTPNEQREQLGFDKIEGDPNMDKVYIPANLTSLEDVGSPTGGGLDQQINDLNNP